MNELDYEFDFGVLTQKQEEVLKYWLNEMPKILVCYGAKRAGKTFILTLIFLMMVAMQKGKGYNYIIAGTTQASIYRNVLQDIEKLIGRHITLNKKNGFELFGNMIYCFEGANSDSYKKARGFTAAGAYLNEGTTLNETFVREIESRVSEIGINRFILVDTNPENPMHFLKTSYIDQSGSVLNNGKTHIKAFRFVLDDSHYVQTDPEYIESIKKSTPSGMYFDRDILGLFVAAEGVVYKDFDDKVHIVDSFNDNDVIRYFGAVDWGYEHPGVVGVFAEMKDKSVIMIECIKEQHKDVIDYWIPKMQELSRKYNIKVWNCDSARPEYIARGNRSGMRLVNARKEVQQGIETVARFFKVKRFMILKSCSDKFLQEIYTYVYKPNSDEPIGLNDDIMDMMRYGLHTEYRREGMIPNCSVRMTGY